VFYKAGEIESWGRGFDKVMGVCKKEKAPYPEIDVNSRGVMVLCKLCEQYNKLLKDRPRKELFRLCEVGILEQKGAGRSSYYERK
ncbi:MAG: ATP-dependent DNA helicase RecG, partial [Lachnospiraceae bacterium]|nr:ATP-dependent DNA helicase RecG [Lachnospiraceae bacterium]